VVGDPAVHGAQLLGGRLRGAGKTQLSGVTRFEGKRPKLVLDRAKECSSYAEPGLPQPACISLCSSSVSLPRITAPTGLRDLNRSHSCDALPGRTNSSKHRQVQMSRRSWGHFWLCRAKNGNKHLLVAEQRFVAIYVSKLGLCRSNRESMGGESRTTTYSQAL
jgi:hypothetical protein